jgi:CBS domain-containing protein
MTQRKPGEEVLLPVHEVRTELGEGEVQVRRTVGCPTVRCAVELECCEACPHLVSVLGVGEPQAVLCRPVLPLPPAPPPSEPYDALLSPLLEHARVGEVMTRDVCCVGEEVRAEEVALLLAEHAVGGVPVVDEEERLVGVVGRSDLLQPEEGEVHPFLLHPERADATAASLMHQPPVMVEEHTTVARAAAVMASARAHRVVVVSTEKRVVGVLTALDVVRWVARKAGYAV